MKRSDEWRVTTPGFVARCEHAVHQKRCPSCGSVVKVEQLTLPLTPSATLRRDDLIGTYPRAVALVADMDPAQTADDLGQSLAVAVVADLFGKEPGEIAHDVRRARKREASNTTLDRRR